MGTCRIAAHSQTATVQVDITPGHAINSFDPDSALGSSIDVLSRTGIDKVYTPHIVQEALSAGGGRLRIATTPNFAWRHGIGPKTETGATGSKSGYFTCEQRTQGTAALHPELCPAHRGFSASGDRRSRARTTAIGKAIPI
jgi:hypothetical protein